MYNDENYNFYFLCNQIFIISIHTPLNYKIIN